MATTCRGDGCPNTLDPVELTAATDAPSTVPSAQKNESFDFDVFNPKYLADEFEDAVWRMEISEKCASLCDGEEYVHFANESKKNEGTVSDNKRFMRRLKRLSEEDKETVLEEIESLNLTYFLSEVASIIVNLNIKSSSIRTTVEIVVALCVHYKGFCSDVISALQTKVDEACMTLSDITNGTLTQKTSPGLNNTQLNDVRPAQSITRGHSKNIQQCTEAVCSLIIFLTEIILAGVFNNEKNKIQQMFMSLLSIVCKFESRLDLNTNDNAKIGDDIPVIGHSHIGLSKIIVIKSLCSRANQLLYPPPFDNFISSGNHADDISAPEYISLLMKKGKDDEDAAKDFLYYIRMNKFKFSTELAKQALEMLNRYYEVGVLDFLEYIIAQEAQFKRNFAMQIVDFGVASGLSCNALAQMAKIIYAVVNAAKDVALFLGVASPDVEKMRVDAAAAVERNNRMDGERMFFIFGGDGKDGKDGEGSDDGEEESDPWLSSEEREFYCDTLDLEQILPASVLSVKEDDLLKTEKNENNLCESTDDINVTAEISNAENAAIPFDDLKREEQPGNKVSKKSNSAQRSPVQIFFDRLNMAYEASDVDKLVLDFFQEGLNTLPNRKALAKGLLSVKRSQVNALPAYARLLATLKLVFKRIVNGVIEGVKERTAVTLKPFSRYDVDIKVGCAVYMAELSKARLIPPGVLCTVLNDILDDLSLSNAEVISSIIDRVGYFLVNDRMTKVRFSNFFEKLLRMKSAMHLPLETETILDNSIFALKKQILNRREKNSGKLISMSSFIRHFFENILYSIDMAVALKICRKLAWTTEPAVEVEFRKCILETSLCGQLDFTGKVANLLRLLAPYQSAVVINCIDALLDSIQTCLENSDPRDATHMVQQVSMLGELYNHCLVGSSALFDVLYSFIGYGGTTMFQAGDIRTAHKLVCVNGMSSLKAKGKSGQTFSDGKTNSYPEMTRFLIDDIREMNLRFYEQRPLPLYNPQGPTEPLYSFLRVKLCCVLINTSGKYFGKGTARLAFDRFLLHFYRYCLTKSPLPKVLLAEVIDTVEKLRPDIWGNLLTQANECLKNLRNAVVEADEAIAYSMIEERKALLDLKASVDIDDFQETEFVSLEYEDNIVDQNISNVLNNDVEASPSSAEMPDDLDSEDAEINEQLDEEFTAALNADIEMARVTRVGVTPSRRLTAASLLPTASSKRKDQQTTNKENSIGGFSLVTRTSDKRGKIKTERVPLGKLEILKNT